MTLHLLRRTHTHIGLKNLDKRLYLLYSPLFEDRLSKLELHLNHYYIAVFQFVPLENDIDTLKKAIIDEAVEAKHICSQMYYICYRILRKKDAVPPSSELLAKINASSDIFTLETTIHELIQYTRNQFAGSAGVQNKIIENTLKYIQQNLSASLSLEVIAEHLHISAPHLSRTFKKYCDIPGSAQANTGKNIYSASVLTALYSGKLLA